MISPASGHLVRSFPVGGDPAELTVGAGAVWALNAGDDTVTRIDIHGHADSTFGTGGIPINLAAGDGSLWVENGTGVTGLGGTPFPSEVSRLDPDTAVTLATLPLSASETSPTQGDIAVGQQGVWVVNPDATVSRIDPASDRVVQTDRWPGRERAGHRFRGHVGAGRRPARRRNDRPAQPGQRQDHRAGEGAHRGC